MDPEINNETQTEGKPTTGRALRVGLVVVGILAIPIYAAMFIPAASGEPVTPKSGYASLFWAGLFFYLWWRRRGQSGWIGALIGAVVGLLVFFLAAFLAGVTSHA